MSVETFHNLELIEDDVDIVNEEKTAWFNLYTN
jgi:hypothetical protein